MPVPPEFYLKPYVTEMLFVENKTKYWLAVRKDSLARLKELKRGDATDLYIIRLGGIRAVDKLEWLFLVEKFLKPN